MGRILLPNEKLGECLLSHPYPRLPLMDLGRILRVLTDVPAGVPAEREPAQAPSQPAPAKEPAPKDA